MVYPYGARMEAKDSVLEAITRCMGRGYLTSDAQAMFACWSSAATFFGMPKSADIASVCPFHYNHWYFYSSNTSVYGYLIKCYPGLAMEGEAEAETVIILIILYAGHNSDMVWMA